jgi:hypothetical protein
MVNVHDITPLSNKARKGDIKPNKNMLMLLTKLANTCSKAGVLKYESQSFAPTDIVDAINKSFGTTKKVTQKKVGEFL